MNQWSLVNNPCLHLTNGLALVIGLQIGSGIFSAPSQVSTENRVAVKTPKSTPRHSTRADKSSHSSTTCCTAHRSRFPHLQRPSRRDPTRQHARPRSCPATASPTTRTCGLVQIG